MSSIEEFEELLRGSEDLQAKFKAAAESFGEVTDEKSFFDAVITPLAAEAGLDCTYEDACAAVKETQELDDAELDAITGGTTDCLIVGLGDVEAAAEAYRFFACAIMGVSFVID